MLLLIKLYHWNTMQYGNHKATDELYSKFNESMDDFVEVLLGTTGQNIPMPTHASVPLVRVDNPQGMKREIDSFVTFLNDLSTNPAISTKSTDLMNIRDELLAHMHQFLYLLRLQ